MTGQEKALHQLGFQGGMELGGLHEIIFNGIGRPHDFSLLQSGDAAEELQLDFHGQTIAQAFGVNLLSS